MKKKVLIIAIIGITISVLVSCFPTEHYLITDIEFDGLVLTNPTVSKDEDKKFRIVEDTLKNRLYFNIFGKVEFYASINNLSLINSCYATSLPTKIDNKIRIDSLELRLDSDIYFENDTIKKNTNLWNHPLLQKYQWFQDNASDFDLRYNIKFGFVESLYDKLNIPPQNYNIELICKTSDNREFVKKINLFIKLHD